MAFGTLNESLRDDSLTAFSNSRLYDNEETSGSSIKPGALPTVLDPPSRIPDSLPRQLPPDGKDRYHSTPMYESLT